MYGDAGQTALKMVQEQPGVYRRRGLRVALVASYFNEDKRDITQDEAGSVIDKLVADGEITEAPRPDAWTTLFKYLYPGNKAKKVKDDGPPSFLKPLLESPTADSKPPLNASGRRQEKGFLTLCLFERGYGTEK